MTEDMIDMLKRSVGESSLDELATAIANSKHGSSVDDPMLVAAYLKKLAAG